MADFDGCLNLVSTWHLQSDKTYRSQGAEGWMWLVWVSRESAKCLLVWMLKKSK